VQEWLVSRDETFTFLTTWELRKYDRSLSSEALITSLIRLAAADIHKADCTPYTYEIVESGCACSPAALRVVGTGPV
jgi:hypothetical protein